MTRMKTIIPNSYAQQQLCPTQEQYNTMNGYHGCILVTGKEDKHSNITASWIIMLPGGLARRESNTAGDGRSWEICDGPQW